MKTYMLSVVLPFLLAGCCPTRIVTVTPHIGTSYAPYTTTVTVPRTKTVTTTTSVQAVSEDISLHLDLQAIGAAFAQSSTVQEFENLINNSSYMLSNLDLNGDGYVDYLRVLETVEGYNHVFVIQAVLGDNLYQDVATLVAEVPSATKAYVQIIGDPYIYGPSYYVEPVYYTTPLIFAHLLAHTYRPWRSPWYWGCYPSYYRRPAPIHISHYHAYVHTYMTNHHYCHTVSYPTVCHCPTYINICKVDIHNDYGTRYPERSFAIRNADLPRRIANTSIASQPTRVLNASVVRELNAANTRTTTTSTRNASNTVTRSASTSAATRSASATTRSATTTTSRSASTSTTRSTDTGTTTSHSTSTATGSRSAGTATTRSATTATPATRSATTTRSTGSTTTRSAASTTTRSRVNNSGTSNTRISTVSPSGNKTTVTRGSSSAGRSANTATATRRAGSTATRSAGSSTRSSSTTTRSGSGTSRR